MSNWYRIQKEEKKKYLKKWRKENPKWMKDYRLENKEHIKEYYKKYYDKNRQKLLKLQTEYRHKKGINKKYISAPRGSGEGVSYTKEYKKLYHHKMRVLKKDLTVQTIQLVYENNIKKYGTLTCYLCLKTIEFKKDCLEHKTPVSRGGTNEYDNLAIAHLICNNRKRNKTEKEFRERFLLV